ncbi:MAG: CidA/LrgA family protein [Alphaproteobacteria bacterium]
MIWALSLFLACQLAGEATVVALGLSLPGPVVGMGYLLAGLLIFRRAPDAMDETAKGMLKHLSLLFVPASVGLIQHGARLTDEWAALAVALVVSTVAAIAVGALTFVAVARLVSVPAEGEDRKE